MTSLPWVLATVWDLVTEMEISAAQEPIHLHKNECTQIYDYFPKSPSLPYPYLAIDNHAWCASPTWEPTQSTFTPATFGGRVHYVLETTFPGLILSQVPLPSASGWSGTRPGVLKPSLLHIIIGPHPDLPLEGGPWKSELFMTPSLDYLYIPLGLIAHLLDDPRDLQPGNNCNHFPISRHLSYFPSTWPFLNMTLFK